MHVKVNPPGSESLMRGEGMGQSEQNVGGGKGKDEILTLSSLLDESLLNWKDKVEDGFRGCRTERGDRIVDAK